MRLDVSQVLCLDFKACSARVRAFLNDYLPWYTSEYIDVADRPWASDLDLEYQMQHQA